VINRARAQHRPTLRPPGPFGRLCLLGILTSVALCTLVEARPVDELSGLVGTTWYTVSLLGQKIGYAYRTVEIDRQAEGGPVLRVIQSIETQLKLKGSDETLTVESLITSTYDANLQPLALTVRNNEFGRVRNISARVWNDSIEVSSESGGALTRETIQKPETFGTDLPLTLDIIRGDAKVGQTLSRRFPSTPSTPIWARWTTTTSPSQRSERSPMAAKPTCSSRRAGGYPWRS